MLRRIFLFTLLLALPAAAQQFPAQQRGLSADTAYQAGEIDQVNLFNGNLSLSLPLGQPYPVGPSFSLGFSLRYNSKVWDYEEAECDTTFPPEAVVYNVPQPDRLANAGVGWLLTPGRLLDPSTVKVENPLNPGPNWVYVSSDGGHHALYPRLHPGYPATPSASGTLYSNDGTYLRHKQLSAASCRSVVGTSGDCRIVEFPNGSRHEFLSFDPFDWRVVRMQDAFGNKVDIDYQFTGGTDSKWTFKDPYGREHVVDFENGRVRWLRFKGFGGTTSDWEFRYETATIERHNYSPPSCAPTQHGETVEVTFLSRIVRPDASYFDFDYNLTDLPGSLAGAISSLRYPTGGSLSWTYQIYVFPKEDPSVLDGPAGRSSGIKTRTTRLADGTEVGTWTYTVQSTGNPTAPGNVNSPCFHDVTVRDPLGQETEHFFSSVENSHFWAYGLPYTYCDPASGAYDDQSGAFLSQRVWSGAAGTSTLLRSTWVEYDTDGPLADDDQNRNHRLRYQKTVFEDDGDRFVETTNSDFDGLGHWRQSVTSGDFGPSKKSVTSFRPGGGTLLLNDDTSLPQSGNSFVMPAENDRWLFGTYTRTTLEQANEGELVADFCFEADTGFLTRSRQLAGTSPGTADVFSLNVRNDAGFLSSQQFHGGDGGSLDTTYSTLCDMDLPIGDPQFRVDHTFSQGSLATSKWIDPCDNSALLTVADATIDAATGLAAKVRDASGFETTLSYDNMSRLVAEEPEEGAWSNVIFKFPKVDQSPPDIPSVLTESCAYGQSSCSGTSRGFSRYKEFDGLGRLTREALALPVEGDPDQNQSREFTFNALGWKLTESTWQQQKETEFSDYDRFGRVGFIQPPGPVNPAIEVKYHGDRRTHRKTKIETTSGLVDNWVTEERDHFGRLISVCEAQGSQPGATGCSSGQLTTYSYDAADRLTKVCGGASGNACGQTRLFEYDGRGFLLSDTHPEVGPIGNGTTTYQYDALGHPTYSTIIGSVDFELRSSYDRAGRLVLLEQKSGTIWKPLKEFFYARESDGLSWQGGKLVLAKRHNWVDPVSPTLQLGNIDAVVSDAYRYEGIGGRTSKKTTSFRLGGATNVFESSFSYDDFGNLTTITYPDPISWPLSRDKRFRQVQYGYDLGFLTSVEGYAPDITYQLGGMLHQVDYATGATWTQTYNAQDHLPRPHNITLSGVTNAFATGNFSYDGQNNVSQIGSLLFRYDRFGRMVRGDTPSGGTQTAVYDSFGNLTSLTTAGNAQSLATETTTNRLNGVTYDAAGNVTSISLGNVAYNHNFDGLRKMVSLRSAGANQARLFFYDASDERIFAWDCPLSSCEPDHDLERWTLRGLGGEVLRSFSGRDKFSTVWEEDFVYRGGGALLATLKPGTAPGTEVRRYAVVDHLGSVRQIFSEANQSLDRFDFYPFGQEIGSVAAGDPPLKFTGHERDSNGTGKGMLDYMHARYCSPVTARFLSIDPVLGQPGMPQSWNRYSYALNNPIKYNDPNGETANQFATGVQEDIRDFKNDLIDYSFDILPEGAAVLFATTAGSGLDFASTLLEPLRFGDAVGTAVGSDASAGEMTLAVLQDTARGVGLIAPAAGTVRFLTGAKNGMSLADEMAALREAALGKGNFGVGTGTQADAMRLGNAWVGKGSRVASDGRTLVSKDGLRIFRPPSAKPNSPHATTGIQANFQTLERVRINGVEKLRVLRNGHLDVTP